MPRERLSFDALPWRHNRHAALVPECKRGMIERDSRWVAIADVAIPYDEVAAAGAKQEVLIPRAPQGLAPARFAKSKLYTDPRLLFPSHHSGDPSPIGFTSRQDSEPCDTNRRMLFRRKHRLH